MREMILAFCFMAGCSPFPPAVVRSETAVVESPSSCDCAPATSSLVPEATLSDHAGRFVLVLTGEDDRFPERVVHGTLVLLHQTLNLTAYSGVSNPLYGYADIDLMSVGAYRVGDPGSKNMQAPGVLVLEYDRGGERVIILRFGSEANRRDRVRYDGAYTVLEVQRIDEGGFVGSWRSGLGLTRASGCFCAVRIPSH